MQLAIFVFLMTVPCVASYGGPSPSTNPDHYDWCSTGTTVCPNGIYVRPNDPCGNCNCYHSTRDYNELVNEGLYGTNPCGEHSESYCSGDLTLLNCKTHIFRGSMIARDPGQHCQDDTSAADQETCANTATREICYSPGTITCRQCVGGTQRTANQDMCNFCPAGQCSRSGQACESCAPRICRAVGTGELANCYTWKENCPLHEATSDGINCEPCPHGQRTISAGDTCSDCPDIEPSGYVNVYDYVIFYAIPRNLETDRGCSFCNLLSNLKYDASTNTCEKCGDGSRVVYSLHLWGERSSNDGVQSQIEVEGNDCALCSQGKYDNRASVQFLFDFEIPTSSAVDTEARMSCTDCPAGFGAVTLEELHRDDSITCVKQNPLDTPDAEFSLGSFVIDCGDQLVGQHVLEDLPTTDSQEYFYACGMCPSGKYSTSGSLCQECEIGKFTSAAFITNDWKQGPSGDQHGNADFWKHERADSCLTCNDFNKFTFYHRQTVGNKQYGFPAVTPPYDSSNGLVVRQDARSGNTVEVPDKLFFYNGITGIYDVDKYFALGITQSWISEDSTTAAYFEATYRTQQLEPIFRLALKMENVVNSESTQSVSNTFEGPTHHLLSLNPDNFDNHLKPVPEFFTMLFEAGMKLFEYRGCIACSYYYYCETQESSALPDSVCKMELFPETVTQLYRLKEHLNSDYSDAHFMSFAGDPETDDWWMRNSAQYPNICGICGANFELDFSLLSDYYDETVDNPCRECPAGMQRYGWSLQDCRCTEPNQIRGHVNLAEYGFSDPDVCYNTLTSYCNTGYFHEELENHPGLFVCKVCPTIDIDGVDYYQKSKNMIVDGYQRSICDGLCDDGFVMIKSTRSGGGTARDVFHCHLCPPNHFMPCTALNIHGISTCKPLQYTTNTAVQSSTDILLENSICAACPPGTMGSPHLHGQFFKPTLDQKYCDPKLDNCPCTPCDIMTYHELPNRNQDWQASECIACPHDDLTTHDFKQLYSDLSVVNYWKSPSENSLGINYYSFLHPNIQAKIHQIVWPYNQASNVCEGQCDLAARKSTYYELSIVNSDNFAGMHNFGRIAESSYLAGDKIIYVHEYGSNALKPGFDDVCQVCDENSNFIVGGTHCENCVSNVRGVCTKCEEGHYVTQLEASDPWTCLPCAVGKYRGTQPDNFEAQKSCLSTASGQYVNSEGATQPLLCDRGKFQHQSQQSSCIECPRGTYQDQFGSSECLLCGYETVVGELNDLAHKFTDYTTKSGYNVYQDLTGQLICKNCNAGGSDIGYEACSTLKLLPWTPGTTARLSIGTPDDSADYSGDVCAQIQSDSFTGDNKKHCFTCDSTLGQGYREGEGCADCPSDHYSVNGQCRTCPAGTQRFQGMNLCVKCLPCPDGYYMDDTDSCTNVANCKRCPSCDDPSMVRVGCMNNAGSIGVIGECRPRVLVKPTAVCPFSEHLETFKNFYFGSALNSETLEMSSFKTNFGLGGFSFREVFGKSYELAEFQCRRICDGSQQKISVIPSDDDSDVVRLHLDHGITDGGQCAGPFACDVQACTMESSMNSIEANYRIPRGCPAENMDYTVVDAHNAHKFDEIRSVNCQPCSECGKGNSQLVPNFGRGCAKECTQLICDENEIFDFTRNLIPLRDGCTTCQNLHNLSLCSEEDLKILQPNLRDISGNRPMIYFKDCIPKLGLQRQVQYSALGFADSTYGSCTQCPMELSQCNLNEIYVSCFQNPNSVENEILHVCELCREIPNLIKTRQLIANILTETTLTLFCQVLPCADPSKTGLSQMEGACFKSCETLNCRFDEYLKPCVFPNHARCVKRYPYREDERIAIGIVGHHANLFEHLGTQLFSGFENAMLDVSVNSRICVWNAKNVDSDMHPGGVSNDLSDNECNLWTEDKLFKTYPLLPFQNVITLTNTVGDINPPRRFFTNTNAIAYSHLEYHRFFDLIGLELELQYIKNAQLGLIMPIDRQLYEMASWIPQLKVSFFVKGSDDAISVCPQSQMGYSTYSDIENLYAAIDDMNSDYSYEMDIGTSFDVEDENSADYHLLPSLPNPDWIQYYSTVCPLISNPLTTKSYLIKIPVGGTGYGILCESKECVYNDLSLDDSALSRLAKMVQPVTNYTSIIFEDMTSLDVTSAQPYTNTLQRISHRILKPSFDSWCVGYVSSRAAIYCIDFEHGTNSKIWPDNYYGHIENFCVIASDLFIVVQQHNVQKKFHFKRDSKMSGSTVSERVFPNQILSMVGTKTAIIALNRDLNTVYRLSRLELQERNLETMLEVEVNIVVGDAIDSHQWIMEINNQHLIILIPMRSGTVLSCLFNVQTFSKISEISIQFDVNVISSTTAQPSALFLNDDSVLIGVDGQVWLLRENVATKMPATSGIYNHIFVFYFNSIVTIPLSISRKFDSGLTSSACGRFFSYNTAKVSSNTVVQYTNKNMCMHLCFENVFFTSDTCLGFNFHNNVCTMYKKDDTGSNQQFCHKILFDVELFKIVDTLNADKSTNLIFGARPRVLMPKDAILAVKAGDTMHANIYAIFGQNPILKCDLLCVYEFSQGLQDCRSASTKLDSNEWVYTSKNLYHKLYLPKIDGSFLEVAKPVQNHVVQSHIVAIKLHLHIEYFTVTIERTCTSLNSNEDFDITYAGFDAHGSPISHKSCSSTENETIIIWQHRQLENLYSITTTSNTVFLRKQMTNYPQGVFYVYPTDRITHFSKLSATEFKHKTSLFIARQQQSFFKELKVSPEWQRYHHNIKPHTVQTHLLVNIRNHGNLYHARKVYFDAFSLNIVLSRETISSHPEVCAAGQFAMGFNLCSKCAPGKFAASAGRYMCEDCPRGKYQNETGGIECKSCEAGKTTYQDATDDINGCEICMRGTYAIDAGSSACALCPEGYEGTVLYSPSLPTSLEIGCSICAAGKFSTGGQEICQNCPATEFSEEGQSSCLQCKPGKYVRDHGIFSNESMCAWCPRGTFNNLFNQTHCFECPINTFQPLLGQRSRHKCKPCSSITNAQGPVANSNQSACICGYGSYGTFGQCIPCPRNSESFLNAISSADCHCVAGYTFNNESASCESCPVGKFSKGNKSDCVNCAEGYYNAFVGASACRLCPPAYTSRPGQTYCIPSLCDGCPVGKYSSKIGSTSSDACIDCASGTYSLGTCQSCIMCPLGKFSNAHSSTCEDCPVNTYANTTQSEECYQCPEHQYNDQTGSSACLLCDAGYHKPDFETSCVSCPSRFTSNRGSSCFIQCLPGSIQLNTQECTPCTPGYFEKDGVCVACAAGTYQNSAMATDCLLCESNYVSQSGSIICDQCGAGTYANVDKCSPCPPNTYKTSGDSECIACPVNLFSQAGSTNILDCIYDSTKRFLNIIVYVPTLHDLEKTFLIDNDYGVSPLQGSNSLNWERLHVMVSMSDASLKTVGCSYRIYISELDNEGTILPRGRLAEMGCTISMTSAMSACHLEIPTSIVFDHHVAMQAVAASDFERCEWPFQFDVMLEQETTLYQCELSHFWSETEQQCKSCAVELNGKLGLDTFCPPGEHVLGCDALAAHGLRCESCPLPDNMHPDVFKWSEDVVCEYNCIEGYYQDNDGYCNRCTNVLFNKCDVGHRRAPCTSTQNEHCVPCDPIQGFFADNQEFVTHPTLECMTACKSGLFFAQDNQCLPCKTIPQLLVEVAEVRIASSEQFYRFRACDANSDSSFLACAPILEGGLLVADAVNFGEPCGVQCQEGYYAFNGNCLPCSSLQHGRYFIDDKCNFACNQSLGFYAYNNDCLDCSASCEIGFYREQRDGVCECAPCSALLQNDWLFLSEGMRVDDRYSCDYACKEGYYRDFTVCRPYSELVCENGFYLITGNADRDHSCWPCSHCLGKRKIASCTSNTDTICEDCPELDNGALYFGENCSYACRAKDVWNRATEKCEICEEHYCGLNSYHPPLNERDNCTHCVQCDPAAPLNAIMFENTCRWACPLGYELEGNACVEMAFAEMQRRQRSGGYGCPVLSCSYGQIPVPQIDACSRCVPCSESAISRPPALQENVTWVWKTGFECTVECKRGFSKFKEGSAILCLNSIDYNNRITHLMRKEETFETALWKNKKNDNQKPVSWFVFFVVIIALSLVSLVIVIV